MLDDVREQGFAAGLSPIARWHPYEPAQMHHAHQPIGHQAVVLEARWLEETWLNARLILSDQDPFLQALQLQRRTTTPARATAAHTEPMSLA